MSGPVVGIGSAAGRCDEMATGTAFIDSSLPAI
jgi:hypothetical protein